MIIKIVVKVEAEKREDKFILLYYIMPTLEHLQQYSKNVKPITFAELLERIKNFHLFDLLVNLLQNNKDKMEEEDNDLPPVTDPRGYSLD